MNPAILLGSLMLGAGVVLSRRQSVSDLGWLGDEPTAAPSSYDPSRSNKNAYARTHIAKRFWGATVLSAQAAVSLDKLAGRVRAYNPDAAGQAVSVAEMMKNSANEAGKLALRYDEAWVRNRMRRSGIAFEPGTT